MKPTETRENLVQRGYIKTSGERERSAKSPSPSRKAGVDQGEVRRGLRHVPARGPEETGIFDGCPSPYVELDMPTLRLDDAGRRAAARHIAQGPIKDRHPFPTI